MPDDDRLPTPDGITDDGPAHGRRRAISVLLVVTGGLVAALAALVLSGSTTAGAQTEETGEIIDFEILVPDQALTVGDSITFVNNAGNPHTVTDRGGEFDTGEVAPGQTGTVTFEAPGSFEVFCQINPSTMSALVVVEPGPEPPARVRVQAYDQAREQELRFDPVDLAVEEGTEVSLANVGGLPHTLTAEDGSFTTGIVQPGAEQGTFAGTSGSVVLTEAGTFPFFCEIHPDLMRGTVTVAGEPEEDAVPDPLEEGEPEDAEAVEEVEEAAAGPDPPDDGTDAAAYLAAAVLMALGLAAVVVAGVAGRPG